MYEGCMKGINNMMCFTYHRHRLRRRTAIAIKHVATQKLAAERARQPRRMERRCHLRCFLFRAAHFKPQDTVDADTEIGYLEVLEVLEVFNG